MNLTAARLLDVERGSTADLFLGTRLGPGSAQPLLATLALQTGLEESLDVALVSAHERRGALRLLI